MIVIHEETKEDTRLQEFYKDRESYHPYTRMSRTRVTHNPEKDVFGLESLEFKEGKHGQGKRYFFWKTVKRISVQYRPEGYFLIRSSGADARKFTQISLNRDALLKPFGITRELNFFPEFTKWVESKTVNTDHPLFEHYHLTPSAQVSAWDGLGPLNNVHIPFFAEFMRSQNPMELTRRLFGVTRYRRDLVKAVASTSINNVAIAWAARGTMPIDWIIAFLRENENAESLELWSNTHRPLRKILKHVRPKVQKKLLREVAGRTNNYARYLNDIDKLIPNHHRLDQDIAEENFHDPRITDLMSLHDVLFEYKRLKQRERDEKDFDEVQKMNELGSALHETAIDRTHKIVVAQTKRDLVQWGTMMHNCIGGYTHSLGKTHTVLGAIYAHDELMANFEIRIGEKPQLQQLLGKFNHSLDRELREKTTQVLTAHGVHTDHYWGE